MTEPLRRYPFPVAEWTRLQWASEPARATWEPRLARITQAWEATERASVGSVRSACRQTIPSVQIPELVEMATEKALILLPLEGVAQPAGYQAGPGQVLADGEAPWGFQVALVTRGVALEWQAAWRINDDEALGAMLGYPECCRKFFQRTWVDEGWIDTTWPQALGLGAFDNPLLATPAGSYECSMLLRWLGVRWVPHLPCSFNCGATVELANKLRTLMRSSFAEESDWINELLDMPVEWSALHGTAEIVTPLVTVSAKTDATAETLVVRREGSTYPEKGAYGLGFPYRREKPAEKLVQLTEPPVSRSGDSLLAETLWADNGFGSTKAMLAAHEVISAVAREALAHLEEPPSVLDLGCGNGLLARQIAGPDGSAFGWEINPDRAKRASEHVQVTRADFLSQFEGVNLRGNDLTLLMPGRLSECEAADAAAFVNRLHSAKPRLLVYAYGDWLAGDTLTGLCRRAGLLGDLELHEMKGDADGLVAAGIWRWP
jgi:hypothetical protein